MPLLGPTMDGRNEVFKRLKPPCVALSQAALALNSSSRNVQTVTARLEELQDVLTLVTTRLHSLDEKLADYIFFPLSQILKFSQRVSVRCLELTFQCLAILIQRGWRSHIQPQLAGQIIILCTLMAEKNPKGLASTETTDELQASAFTCLHHLFDVLDVSSEATKSLVADTNVPQMGQTISTILDGILEGLSLDSQTAAVGAMRSLINNVATRDIKASFLPGIVSKLTKVLVPQTKQRRDHAVLIGALDILRGLFVATLGSIQPKMASHSAVSSADVEPGQITSNVINKQWLETAAVQLKPAVESITRLKGSGRDDVKDALARLCLAIIKECRITLSNCAASALETLLFLSSEPSGDAIKFQLEMLVISDPALSKSLQGSLHDSLQSLPTQMQISDEQLKVQRIKQISTAYGIVGASGADTSFVDRLLANTLRDSVVVTLQTPGVKLHSASGMIPVQSLELATINKVETTTDFKSPLVRYRGQERLLDALQNLALAASKTANSSLFPADLARSLRQSQGEAQIAAFWLLLDCTQAMYQQDSGVDAFLHIAGESFGAYREHLEDLYSFSLEILTDATEDNIDPRFQALALRALALKAQVSGEDFRYELIDALYPILHTLATPDEALQGDSITTLNIITKSCGYSSVQDLIVENVDYLTNAVALKLNAFDVSPQGPQVLLMMVRLAGPSLLPYLEDTIGSIFAALEDYHGYPLLVELLFRVLGVVAEEGSKAPQLAITADTRAEMHHINDDRWRPTSISSLASLLKERAAEQIRASAEFELEPHPKRPWKQDESVENEEEQNEEDQEDQQIAEVDPPPPAPKTYALLLKISDLTQHFLPSASASLRMSLLALIKTTIPAIARHENSFLPLINTLWPEIVSRLDDPEPQVLATALDIVALLCEYAGDFMRSRVLQLWPIIMEIHTKTASEILQIARPGSLKRKEHSSLALVAPPPDVLKKAIARMRASPADYSDTSTRMAWSSLVKLIVAAVEFVGLPPERFDEGLDMLAPVLEEEGVRKVLERVNADAVWLCRVRSGVVGVPDVPDMEGSRWRFAGVTV